MAMKRAVSMIAAIALATAPTIASAVPSTASPIRAGATVADPSALEGGSWTLWLGLAIVAGVLVIALSGNDNILPEVPASP